MATEMDGVAKIATVPKTTANPYETNPENIPPDDPFLAQSAQYGRYAPHPDDFSPHYNHWYQSDPDTDVFWQEVARKYCTPEHSLNTSGPREVFTAGSVIIRVDRESVEGAAAKRYPCVNANELSSARKVEESFKQIGVAVPVIYFCGTIEGRNVTVESRIPGVSLEVAWRYLSANQVDIFKNQCRQILQNLSTIDPSSDEPSYVCRGLNSQPPPPGQEQERSILFTEKDPEEELSLTHNDLVPANIIVNNGRVVGITGWRECGYFGFARAKAVHRSLKDFRPISSQGAVSVRDYTAWTDLYDGDYDPNKCAPLAATEDTSLPSVKTEPTTSTLDRFPTSDDLETGSLGYDGAIDHPTSKKLADLKNGLTSRASSSDRSSPATSVKPASNKKAASVASKKGTAKKPTTTKKRKVNDADADSVDGRRSNTPASRTSKVPGKKQDSASVAGSPAPEEKKKPRKRGKKPATADDEEDYEDENEVFCICRRPDNHTWMIGCDGGCEDWFHGKCVNIDRRDAELIDKYICPNCSQRGKGCTTWKPMCRLPECRKPARVARKNPSKYCSDEHGQEFMRRQTRHLKLGSARKGQEDLGSMGGILTAGDLKAAIMGVTSVAEFRKLGDRIIAPAPASTKENTPNVDVKTETNSPVDSPSGFDIDLNGLEYSADEAAKIEKLRKHREELLHRKEMLAARSAFVSLLRQRSKGVVEKLKQNDPKGGWKDICGFDSRLSWSDEEFDEWRLSDAGKKALAEGTVEALAASYPSSTDADGDTAMDGEGEDEMAFLTRGVCTKKRCERHKQWVKVQQQDIVFEENTADQDLSKYEQQAHSVAERAVLRKWAEKENVLSHAR
ncbi:uncharacterized protein N7459_006543 [Penicillium hispanicum]|uniref:uncharacterized protein n=1 Tax=Penicillium hispanicum TaxID=1080232 RepID=UPI00253FA749|nr:uncharacterized protein N7459_006543 [Penicillium hispanicum]KAJ5577579.1 hypothetical protein N7459_006543 [Penicillium hispanicum]